MKRCLFLPVFLAACTTDFDRPTFCASHGSDPRCGMLLVHDGTSMGDSSEAGGAFSDSDSASSDEDLGPVADSSDAEKTDSSDAEVPDGFEVPADGIDSDIGDSVTHDSPDSPDVDDAEENSDIDEDVNEDTSEIPSDTDSSDSSDDGDALEPACLVNSDCEPLDDGNICNGAFFCIDGTCVYSDEPITCKPNSACVTSTCVPATGDCVEMPIVCADDNPCTNDVCIGGACTFLPNADACDDEDPCTDDDACLLGACSGTQMCTCTSDSDCDELEDDDLCNGTLTCDMSELPWTCVVDETTVITCEDEDPLDCMDVSCSPATAQCDPHEAPEKKLCDDGSACTDQDACSAGSCQGSDITCDDQSVCTTDTCNSTDGCVFTPTAIQPCDDAQTSTITDTCIDGMCDGVVPYIEFFDDGFAENWTVSDPAPDDPIQVVVSPVGWPNNPDDLYLAIHVLSDFTLSSSVIIDLQPPPLATPHSPLPVLKFGRWVGCPCSLAFVEFIGHDGSVQDTHCGSESLATSKIDLDSSKTTNVVTIRVTLLPGTYSGASNLFRFDTFLVQEFFKP